MNPVGAAAELADTTIMGIVHDALRRDLARLESALSMPVSPVLAGRRHALGTHVDWMMTFLHHHHHSEDEGLWPLVRGRVANVEALFDRMEAEHARVVPAIAAVSEAGRRLAVGRDLDSSRRELLAALQLLSEVLLPHLRHEEDDAMPLVAGAVSDVEWRRWDQQYNIRGKSLRRLGCEGHFLMDGLDPDRYRVLVHLVPAPARLLIVKGFARSYRKACAARWGADVPVGPIKPKVA